MVYKLKNKLYLFYAKYKQSIEKSENTIIKKGD